MKRRHPVGVVLSIALLTGCVTPAVDGGAFRENAHGAVESGLSETNTASLVVEQVLSEKLTDAVADTSLSNCEDAIGPIEDSFGKVQPPRQADDPLRADVLAALSDADSAIAAARIAARRDDRPALRSALADLESTSRDLERLERDLA